jgi:gelsolin
MIFLAESFNLVMRDIVSLMDPNAEAPAGGGMTKAGTGAKLEDSNIALYGSKEHKDAKLNAAKSELAWTGAGQEVGTEIWRIEKFQVVPWPKTKYGQFFSGDAYIVLYTYKIPDNDSFRYNVHFWLGGTSSQDEQGTAAYKTVELDDLLGDTPVQFREVQGQESEEFLGVFGGKIITMEGGVDSGFNHVKPKEYRPRLLQMKGRKNVRVTEVPMQVGSLNNGDVFLMDLGGSVIQWNGIKAGMFEKRKAVEIITALREDRNGRVEVTVMDGIEDNKTFWETLGQAGGAPPSESQLAPITEDEDKPIVYPTRLFKLSDSSGHLTMTLVGEGKGKILKSKLDMTDVFILDVTQNGVAVIYVWIGKKASKRERANGIKFGVNYLKSNGRPEDTSVVRLTQGRESPEFFDAFDG